MNIKNSVLDYIRYKQLKWYGRVQRMSEDRLPRKILELCPPGRGKDGRPRNLWMQEVTTGIRENGINNIGRMDRQRRMEKKNKTLRTGRCDTINTLYINK